MTVKRGILAAFALTILAILGVALSGRELVNSEAPQKADIVAVIGGDYKGNRIAKAAELVRQGYAPKVLVSGAGEQYGHLESELAIQYAVERGYPRDIFIGLQYPALSTTDEARGVTARLRQMGVHKYLLVTSDFHTARATRVFRRVAPDLEVHPVAAPDPDWNNGRWWITREGRKTWFFETVKTAADYLGI